MPTYTEWYDFHVGLVERVHGGPGTIGVDWNHTAHFRTDGITPLVTSCQVLESYEAHGSYARPFAGAYPTTYPNLTGGAACAWDQVRRGRHINTNTSWSGVCFGTHDGEDLDRGSAHGSGWSVSADADAGPGTILQQTADANAYLGGYIYKPWDLYANYTNQYMDDDALQAEMDAIEFPPGPGWILEWEAFHPIFVGLEYAPDEANDVAGGPLVGNTGSDGITWCETGGTDPLTVGWGLTGWDGTDASWTYGLAPSGTVRAVDYAGGIADWQAAPAHWYPVQSDDPVVCEFVVPDDPIGDAILLTIACGKLRYGSGADATDGETFFGGRIGQALVFRTLWRTPRYRFYNEATLGRLKVQESPWGSQLNSNWKFFVPRDGENDGVGVGKVKTDDGWVRADERLLTKIADDTWAPP